MSPVAKSYKLPPEKSLVGVHAFSTHVQGTFMTSLHLNAKPFCKAMNERSLQVNITQNFCFLQSEKKTYRNLGYPEKISDLNSIFPQLFRTQLFWFWHSSVWKRWMTAAKRYVTYRKRFRLQMPHQKDVPRYTKKEKRKFNLLFNPDIHGSSRRFLFPVIMHFGWSSNARYVKLSHHLHV